MDKVLHLFIQLVLVLMMVVIMVFFIKQSGLMLIKIVLIIKIVLLLKPMVGRSTRGVLEVLKTCQGCLKIWIRLMKISMVGIPQALLI